ncbi:13667_t:CDS:2 [Rhizophagus irregularis]|nr:hypothetical protein RhiirB3_430218 [Rhizophagus irregularis]CAG8758432.1 13667_t:CDS:2 [Rhizophagus irregularis]
MLEMLLQCNLTKFEEELPTIIKEFLSYFDITDKTLTSNRKAGNRHFDIRIIPITEDVIYLISAILEIKVCKKNKNSDEYEYVDELSSDEEIKYGNENEIKRELQKNLIPFTTFFKLIE